MSVRHRSRLLRNPDSQLHGFDSFEGLPAGWIVRRSAGYFSTEGDLPEIGDEPDTFIKGGLRIPCRATYGPRVSTAVGVNMDADLYTSAATALAAAEDHLVPGSFVSFDEFNQRDHEV